MGHDQTWRNDTPEEVETSPKYRLDTLGRVLWVDSVDAHLYNTSERRYLAALFMPSFYMRLPVCEITSNVGHDALNSA